MHAYSHFASKHKARTFSSEKLFSFAILDPPGEVWDDCRQSDGPANQAWHEHFAPTYHHKKHYSRDNGGSVRVGEHTRWCGSLRIADK